MDYFNAIELSQLYQWHLCQKEEKSYIGLPIYLERECHEAFTSTKPTISLLQRDAVSLLRSIGLKPTEEVLTLKGYSLDIIVDLNGMEVGIEIDGPTHFIGRKPTRSTVLKRRQITTMEGI